MKVQVLGPNGINDVTFHVHAADCADIRKPKYRWSRRNWVTEVSSAQELVEDLFSDFIGTGETQHDDGTLTTWEEYANEVLVFPCVKF